MKLYGGRPSRKSKKSLTALIALILIICLAVGGTVAFIVTQTQAVKNTFTPADVKVDIQEVFKDNIKSSITVLNVDDTDKEDVPCYIRVKLVSNIQDNDGNVLRAAPLGEISFNNSDWIDGGDGCYYYKNVVAVGDSTSNLLAEGASIKLTEGQVVEVLAEGIQAMPKQAVIDAWGVTVDSNGSISK